MYTYNRIFVGIPISQTNFCESQELIFRLSEYASNRVDIRQIQDMIEQEEEQLPEVVKFGLWIEENIKELEALGVNLYHNYHGGDDYPQIFGVYLDDLFPVPDFGAERVQFDNIQKIQEILQKFKSIISKLDPQVLQILEKEKLIDVWFNNHSS